MKERSSWRRQFRAQSKTLRRTLRRARQGQERNRGYMLRRQTWEPKGWPETERKDRGEQFSARNVHAPHWGVYIASPSRMWSLMEKRKKRKELSLQFLPFHTSSFLGLITTHLVSFKTLPPSLATSHHPSIDRSLPAADYNDKRRKCGMDWYAGATKTLRTTVWCVSPHSLPLDGR